MERYGVNGVSRDWFRSYLQNRQQRIVIDQTSSPVCTINRGIPQGSVLGPTLFSIFINDLPCALNIRDNLTLYADDINIVLASSSLKDLFNISNKIYSQLNHWLTCNNLSMNTNKTKCILFHNKLKYNVNNFMLNGNIAELTSSCKLLGVVIDEELKWNDHINSLSSELSKVCYALRNLKRSCSLNVLKTFYFSNFYSKMTYGIIHWGSCSDANRVFYYKNGL